MELDKMLHLNRKDIVEKKISEFIF